MNAERLLTHYAEIAEAPDAINRMRRFVLDLAIRGKLLPQIGDDEPVSALLDRATAAERRHRSGAAPSSEVGDRPFAIPPSWVWARLGDIADLVRGISFTASEKSNTPGDGLIPCFRSGNIQSETVWNNFIYVPRSAIKSASQILRPSDILISISNSYELVGKCSIVVDVKEEATFGAFLAVIRPHSASPEYIFHCLSSDYSQTSFRRSSAQTTNIANITFATVRSHSIPIPPLSEQARIVAKVDELMVLCDELEAAREAREAARDRLAAASLARLSSPAPETFRSNAQFALDALPALTARPGQMKQLRQAIVELALRGNLTSASAPATAEMPSGWTTINLGEVIESISNGIYKPSTYYSDNGTVCVRMYNIKDGALQFAKIQRLNLTDDEISRFCLSPGDIVINRVNSRELVGKAAVVTAHSEPLVFEAMNMRMRVKSSAAVPEFINLFLRSTYVRSVFEGSAKQAVGQASISQPQVAGLRIALPPPHEQRRIVAKVDELLALCGQLEVSLSTVDATRRRLLDALLAEALSEPSVAEAA